METVKTVSQVELPDGTVLRLPDTGGGGYEEYKLLNEIIFSEEVASVEITADDEMKELACREIILNIKCVGTSSNDSVSNKNAILKISDISVGYIALALGAGVTRITALNIKTGPYRAVGGTINSSTDLNTNTALNTVFGYSFSEDAINIITKINITMQAGKFGIGSCIQIYGK